MGASKGFSSIFMMILVMFTALWGSFLLRMAEREIVVAEDFFAGFAAENLAYAGICDIMVKLGDRNLVFTEKLKLDVVSPPLGVPGSYRAYFAYQDGKPVVLSVGEYRAAKRQLVAYLRLSDQQKASILYMNKK